MSRIIIVAPSVTAASLDEAIQATEDNGATWSAILTPTSTGIRAASYSAARGVCLFMGTAGAIYRGIGKTFTSVDLIGSLPAGVWQDFIVVDELDLCFACKQDEIWQSADGGENWVQCTAPVGPNFGYARFVRLPYTSQLLVGITNSTNQPLFEFDGVDEWVRLASVGFAQSIDDGAQASNNVSSFGTRNEAYTLSTPDLITYTQRTGSGMASQVAMTYDPITNLFVNSSSTRGMYSADPNTLGWTKRTSGDDAFFGGVEDLIPRGDGGFAGIRPASGGITTGEYVYSDDGLTWQREATLSFPTLGYNRILELFTASIVVPDVVGMADAIASTTIVNAGFTVGLVTEQVSSGPPGIVLSQFPIAGTTAEPGTAVSYVISKLQEGVIPNVIGMLLTDGVNAIRNAGYASGKLTVSTEPNGALGTIIAQFPVGGTAARPGTKVALTVTSLFQPFDVHATVISQYSASPTLVRMVEDMAEYIDPRTNLDYFYNLVWNVDTAAGFGLDIWGRIVGVGRLLELPSDDAIFGYINEDEPPDWEPFNQGIFNPGNGATQAYLLPDDAYRTLILTKALANIVATNAPSMNRLLQNLFPGRGRAYVQDLGAMRMRFVFEFELTSTEFAILTQSGALPHPAGVSYSVVIVPTEVIGFVEAGSDTYKPFDFGPFFLPPV